VGWMDGCNSEGSPAISDSTPVIPGNTAFPEPPEESCGPAMTEGSTLAMSEYMAFPEPGNWEEGCGLASSECTQGSMEARSGNMALVM